MSVWVVRLCGNEFDLQELSRSVNSPELSITQEESGFILKSSYFNQLRNTGEVKNKAGELLFLINGAARLALGMRRNLTIDAVIEIRENGSRVTTRFLSDTMYVSSSTNYTIRRNDGTVEEFHPADPIPEWIRLTESYASVARVLCLLEQGDDDWVNLNRIYEVVRHDVRGDTNIVSNGWTTRQQIERFRRTVNSVSVLGNQARHGVETTEPPPNPMRLSEAKSFIKVLVHNWLISKQA